MTIKNQWKPAARKQAPLFEPYLFQCPICKKAVKEADFITSYRAINAVSHVYEIKNLCRDCRDKGV